MLWTEGIKRSEKGIPLNGLKIENGVLQKCLIEREAKSVRIPDNVEQINADAFDGYDDLKIVVPRRIEEELTKSIVSSLCDRVSDYDNWTKLYIEYMGYGPCLAVLNVDSGVIKHCILEAIKSEKDELKNVGWNVCEIDADDVNAICEEMKSIGLDNLVHVTEDSVSTFKKLPLLEYSPVSQMYGRARAINDLISKEGFGVLYLKNLNEENYRGLPHNFIYNLIKSHSFNFVRLSPKWLVIIQVGKNVVLDAQGGVDKLFDGNRYCFKTPAGYIKYMADLGKVVGLEPKQTQSSFSALFEDDDEDISQGDNKTAENEEPGTNQEEASRKEIDWEERHFQICLALLSRTDINSTATAAIITRADRMIEKLKKHYEELAEKK